MPATNEIREELELLMPGCDWPESYPGHQVPEGYFVALPGSVMSRLGDSGTEVTLPGWGKTNPFAVPGDYFASLPHRVTDRLQPKAVVVKLPRPRSRWSSWAMAAVITLLIALSGLLWLTEHRSYHQQPTLDQQLATLSSESIKQYLNTQTTVLNADEILTTLNDDDFQDASSAISTKGVEEFLNEDIPDSLY